VLEWRRDDVFLPEAQATTEEFPSLRNISAGFMFGGVVRPLEPAPPEYVTLSMRPASDRAFVALAVEHAAGSGPVPAALLRPGRPAGADGEDRRPWRRQYHLRAADTGAVLRVRALLHLPPKRVRDLFVLPAVRETMPPSAQRRR
jgi:hypothetical protein